MVARVFTVSTVKDTTAGVERFVERNLAAGADHMVVFLDGGDPRTSRRFRDHPHVTVIHAGKTHWGGLDATGLNTRQVVDANLVNALLVGLPGGAWLFHIDGDECLDLDRDRLLALPDDVGAVSLQPLEAVSRETADPAGTRFKRLLDPTELALLHTLGVIERPFQRHFFNGHVIGKAGLRPDATRRLALHVVRTAGGRPVPGHTADWLHHLHYESFSGEEFVRKWTNHVGAGAAVFNRRRQVMRSAVAGALANAHVSDVRRRELLLEVYRRTVADDVATLDELGYLVEPDPARHAYTPRPLSPEQRRHVEEVLPRLRRADKRHFLIGGRSRDLVALLSGIAGRVDPSVGDSLRTALGAPASATATATAPDTA